MAKNFEHIIHKNSSTVTDGSPKLPTSLQIEYGELAINYAKDNETISLKNSDDEIVTFSPAKNTVQKTDFEKAQKVTAAALNDLNERIDASGDGVEELEQSLENFKNEVEETEHATALALVDLDKKNNDLDEKIDEVSDAVDTQLEEINNYILEVEEVAANALTDLDTRVNELEETEIPTTLASLSDDSTHRLVTDAEKTTWNGKYSIPSGGIPDTDLSNAVQTSLGKADTAIQQETETPLSKGTTTGAGNAVTDISVSGHEITLTKGSTFLTEHQSIKTINTQTLVGSGDITLATLPTVTAADNGKILMVVDGAWALVSPSTIYTGSGTPSDSQGNNGDIYLQTSSN